MIAFNMLAVKFSLSRNTSNCLSMMTACENIRFSAIIPPNSGTESYTDDMTVLILSNHLSGLGSNSGSITKIELGL